MLTPGELGEKQIEVGDTVLVSIEAANRDPDAFGRADEMDLERDNPRDNLAFGAGAHICPGAFLARLEAIVVLETYLDLVEETALVAGTGYVPNPIYWARGPVALPAMLGAQLRSSSNPPVKEPGVPLSNAKVIDADSHMFEQPGLWRDHMPKKERHLALDIDEDDLGYSWLTHKGNGCFSVTSVSRGASGSPTAFRTSVNELANPPWFDTPKCRRPTTTRRSRRNALDGWGIDEQVIFPNWGLNFGWYLQGDVDAELPISVPGTVGPPR